MNFAECESLVRSFAHNYQELRPGWTVRLYVHPTIEEIAVEASAQVPNSTPAERRAGHPRSLQGETVEGGAYFVVSARKINSEAELARRIVWGLLNGDVHELREFVRFGEDKRAPLHPHSYDGQDAWRDTHAMGEGRYNKLPNGA